MSKLQIIVGSTRPCTCTAHASACEQQSDEHSTKFMSGSRWAESTSPFVGQATSQIVSRSHRNHPGTCG
jgi:hypothetical protein